MRIAHAHPLINFIYFFLEIVSILYLSFTYFPFEMLKSRQVFTNVFL